MSHFINIPSNEYFKGLAEDIIDAIRENEKGIIVLGGGNSPVKINQIILDKFHHEPELGHHFYQNFKCYLSDERFVPITHPDSNYKMLKESLFPHHNNIQPLRTDLELTECVLDYHHKLSQDLEKMPLVLSVLGIGTDGHTASLFPGQINTKITEMIVQPGGKGPEGLNRITLSHSLLLKSKKIFFMANSDRKESALEKAQSHTDINQYPLIPFLNSPQSYFYTQRS